MNVYLIIDQGYQLTQSRLWHQPPHTTAFGAGAQGAARNPFEIPSSGQLMNPFRLHGQTRMDERGTGPTKTLMKTLFKNRPRITGLL